MCVCVCVCAHARARARAHMYVYYLNNIFFYWHNQQFTDPSLYGSGRILSRDVLME